MFRLLAAEVPAAELTEVRRFQAEWEADASIRLRGGEPGVLAVYDRHGRIRAADEEAARERAATAWLADHLRGKDTLLLVGSNEEAADLARRVQAKLVEHGTVAALGYQAQVPLADGNQARPGDLVRARLNTEIDAGGQKLTNRDTLKISAVRGTDAEVRRRQLDGTWTERFWIPRAYLESSAELGYAGNVHVAQGRTVDTAHLLVTDSLSRQALYVGMSRGRETNTAHVVTGSTAPPGQQPYQQATPESVLTSVMQRDASELSATEAIRQSQEWASGTGHLLNLWAAAAAPAMHRHIDQRITGGLDEHQASRYKKEHARQVLHAALRAAQLAVHDIDTVIDRITAAPLDGLRSISAGLHGRLQHLHLTGTPQDATWTERTPTGAPAAAREIAAALDSRLAELGHRHAASPQPWLIDRLGVLPPDASPILRADYERRAGTAAAYREAAGITNPYQGVSPEPHHGNPELENMRREVIHELEYPDEAAMWAGMDRGQLEAHTAAAERAQAVAPPDVSAQLRATAHAEADAWQQAADAQASGDQAQATGAKDLAGLLDAQRERLETQNTEHEQWADSTRTVRANGDNAAAELKRRGHEADTPQGDVTPLPEEPSVTSSDLENGEPTSPQARPEPGPEPQTTLEWLREFEADMAGVERSIEGEHQAGVDACQPWPPARQPATDAGPGTVPETEVPGTEPAEEHDNPGTRITQVITEVEQAARQYADEEASRQTLSDYAARISRDAEAQPEAHASMTAEAPADAEIEL
jgi:hypothetical protein